MDTSQNKRAVDIFEAALEQPQPQRAAFLDLACGDQPDLRAEVESLLRADEQASGFLDPPDQGTHCPDTEHDPLLGTTIGRYNITRVIAAGGMGTVYEASQETPKRTVALKVIRAGLVSPTALRRFRHESEILGRLRHPGIAQIFESGEHGGEHGYPYFAMEYIPGARSITQYAEQCDLTTRQRLELFLKVCDAVHAGHQRGIIHRDLKPANILVDDTGQPKLIDFGVARATDADLTIATLQTDVGAVVGTLHYMSPEQCEGDAVEIDVRSDVYALGVVLFELLTGELPYDFSTASPFDIPRLIRDQEPRRMSSLNRMLRGDIETIVLKALEKDRSRRYQSAPDLIRDIRHYLHHEPIEAKRGRRWYVFSKALRRHRVAAFVTGSFVLLLGVSAVSLFVLYHQAQTQADTAQQVINVLNRALTQSDPYAREGGGDLRALLDKTAAQLEQGFVQDPLVQAAVHSTLGAAYMNLGSYEEGGQHLRAAYDMYCRELGDDHLEAADAHARLAVWQYATGDYDGAERAMRESLPILRRHRNEHPNKFGRCLGGLAVALLYQQRAAEGEAPAREFLEIAETIPGDPDGNVATAANLVSIMLQEQGKLAEAEPFLQRALQRDRERYGDDHARVGRDLQNLAILQRKLGQYEQAEASMRAAIQIAQRVSPPDNPEHAFITQDLANILASEGKDAEAAEQHRQALAIAAEHLDDSNPQKAEVYATAADFFLNHDDAGQALPLAQQAERIARTALPPDNPGIAQYTALTAYCLLALERYDEAEPLVAEAHAKLNAAFGPDDGRTQQAAHSLYLLSQRPVRHDLAGEDAPATQPQPAP